MRTKNLQTWLNVILLAAAAGYAAAAIIPVSELAASGTATVTASDWDIGHPGALFDQNWVNIYRSRSINPAVITVTFDTPPSVGAARGSFSHTQFYSWQLEAADTLADLDSQSGSYVHLFGPEQVPGNATIQWEEFNQAPVTRRIFRFTVERLTGDDYVHIRELELQSPEPEELINIDGADVRINTIVIAPPDQEIATGATQQFTAEASLSYGPDRYDISDLVAWSLLDPALADVSPVGFVTGLNPGVTTLEAAYGVVVGSTPLAVRLTRPPDVNVGFIHRTPEYNRFVVSFSGDQHIDPAFVGEKKWPDPGEEVTYTAHIFNRGDTPISDVAYDWYFDDQLVASGVIPHLDPLARTTVAYTAPWPADTVQTVDIPPGAMDLHPQQRERAVGDHRIRIEVDPDDQIAESCEINNVVEDYINALNFWLFMDETTYELFTKHPGFLESFSPEDWARGQLIGFERRLRVAGVDQKLRLDMVAIYPDGQLSGGGTHEPIGSATRQADGRWGFQIGEWPESKIERFAKIVENPLCHEWGHQIGLIDVYQYDIATQNCLITYNGKPVAGTNLMPTVSPWNVWYGNQRVMHDNGVARIDGSQRALMADVSQRFIAPGSAAGMNRNRGLRRGFFGDYLGAVHQGEISLQVRHVDGTPVANAALRVFQRDPFTGTVPDTPKFAGNTDAVGRWVFPDTALPGWNGGMSLNNPWSWQSGGGIVYDAPNAIGSNAPLVVELVHGGEVEYHFVEVDELNVAMQNDVLDDYTIELVTFSSRAGNRLPTIAFTSSDRVYLDEGEFFETFITAADPDGDPVTLSTTPLYNTTFNPATGRLTFQPDSLQVNRDASYTEGLYVNVRADDGKFTATRRLWFYVRDVRDDAYVNERARPGDLNGDGVSNATDLWIFENCLTGPAAAFNPGCAAADLTGDGSTDLDDLAALQALADATVTP